MFELGGRTALVTGAGRGAGAGIARALARQGAAVLVNDLAVERAEAVAAAIRAAGGRAAAAAFDVTDGDAVASGVQAGAAALGPVDVLVANAGIPAGGMALRPFRELEPGEWRRFVDLNLYGVLHCTRAVLDGMCERGFGRIIVISSEAGRVGLPIGVSLYGAAKAAAVAFVRHLALEVGPAGVTANALSLGLLDNVPEAMREAVARQLPTRRVGTPEDVAAAVVYLASDEAGWVTGQVLPVNGGSAA
jgi:NAD(P)-dependent dehydrogenase (short-subunit alcohol dehydrogenase family)